MTSEERILRELLVRMLEVIELLEAIAHCLELERIDHQNKA